MEIVLPGSIEDLFSLFMYVVKKHDGLWNDNEMIFAFDAFGFVRGGEIYSIAGGKGRVFSIDSYSEVIPDPNNPGQFLNFYENIHEFDRLEAEYRNSWIYRIGLTVQGTFEGGSAEFLQYMAELRLGTHPNSQFLIPLLQAEAAPEIMMPPMAGNPVPQPLPDLGNPSKTLTELQADSISGYYNYFYNLPQETLDQLKAKFDTAGFPSDFNIILDLIFLGALDKDFFEGLDPGTEQNPGAKVVFEQEIKNGQFLDSLDADAIADLLLKEFIEISDIDSLPLNYRTRILDSLTEYYRSLKFGSRKELNYIRLSQRTLEDLAAYESRMDPTSERYLRYQTLKRLFFFNHDTRKDLVSAFLEKMHSIFEEGLYDTVPAMPLTLPDRSDDENYFRKFVDEICKEGLSHYQLLDMLLSENSFFLIWIYNDFFKGLSQLDKDFLILQIRDYGIPDLKEVTFSSYSDYNQYWSTRSILEKDFWYIAYQLQRDVVQDIRGNIFLPVFQQVLSDKVLDASEVEMLEYWSQFEEPAPNTLQDIITLLNDQSLPAEVLIKVFTSVDFLTPNQLGLLHDSARRRFYRAMGTQVQEGTVDVVTINKYIEQGYFRVEHLKGLRGGRYASLTDELRAYYDIDFGEYVAAGTGSLWDPIQRENLVDLWRSNLQDRSDFNRWVVMNQIYEFDDIMLNDHFKILEFHTSGATDVGEVMAQGYTGTNLLFKDLWSTNHEVLLEWGEHRGPNEGFGMIHISIEHGGLDGDFDTAYGIHTDSEIANLVLSTMRDNQPFDIEGRGGDPVVTLYYRMPDQQPLAVVVLRRGSMPYRMITAFPKD